MRSPRFGAVLWGVALLLSWSAGSARANEVPAAQNRFATPDSVVSELYRLVTFKAGTTPDWDKVRALFHRDAVIALRTGRDQSSVFSVQGFVDDFVSFIDRAKVRETGFTERIVHMKPLVFRDIAHVLVLYEASINGSSRPPQQGVDSIQLMRQDGRWWIVALVNDIPSAAAPIPAELRE